MTTPEKSKAKRKTAKRVRRKTPARSGAIRTGSRLPKDEASSQPPNSVGMSPKARADVDLDEGLINKAVADAVSNANQVLTDTIAQGRIAAEHFRHGEYNMRDVPVDVQILGMRMIKLARELSETSLNILEQLLRQITENPPSSPPKGQPSKVPPFPTSPPNTNQPPPSDKAPPSTHAGKPAPPDNRLNLTVKFPGKVKAKSLPSPLWKPSKPTLPSELSVTPLIPVSGNGREIDDVSFEADLSGNLIATVTIPARQAAGVYAGMVVPDNTDTPIGVLTIEVMK